MDRTMINCTAIWLLLAIMTFMPTAALAQALPTLTDAEVAKAKAKNAAKAKKTKTAKPKKAPAKAKKKVSASSATAKAKNTRASSVTPKAAQLRRDDEQRRQEEQRKREPQTQRQSQTRQWQRPAASYRESQRAYGTSYNSRRSRIRRNGGYVLFGLTALDGGYYVSTPGDVKEMGYAGAGIALKIGNYRAPVQLELSATPGVLVYSYDGGGYYDEYYDYYYDDEEDEVKTKFHLPLNARLKVNLLSLGDECKLYVSANGTYNAVRRDDLEQRFAAGGGLGVAWRHWDWTLYYRQGVGESGYDDRYIGTSLIYFF